MSSCERSRMILAGLRLKTSHAVDLLISSLSSLASSVSSVSQDCVDGRQMNMLYSGVAASLTG
jgi:hypothetical protein